MSRGLSERIWTCGVVTANTVFSFSANYANSLPKKNIIFLNSFPNGLGGPNVLYCELGGRSSEKSKKRLRC